MKKSNFRNNIPTMEEASSLLQEDDSEALYVLWIGGELAETFDIDFGKKIIAYQEQYERR